MEHSALTGSNLHESKGVSTAAVSTVYVADGVGSGAWSTISNASLATAAKPFQSQLFHCKDQKSSGTNGGTNAAGWNTRALTSITNEIASASLASNQVTLPAGTYWIEAWGTGRGCNDHKIKWRNVTDGSDTLLGSNENAYRVVDNFNNTLTTLTSISSLSGRFTIAGSKVFELWHYTAVAVTNVGFGGAISQGLEQYADVRIWKVA